MNFEYFECNPQCMPTAIITLKTQKCVNKLQYYHLDTIDQLPETITNSPHNQYLIICQQNQIQVFQQKIIELKRSMLQSSTHPKQYVEDQQNLLEFYSGIKQAWKNSEVESPDQQLMLDLSAQMDRMIERITNKSQIEAITKQKREAQQQLSKLQEEHKSLKQNYEQLKNREKEFDSESKSSKKQRKLIKQMKKIQYHILEASRSIEKLDKKKYFIQYGKQQDEFEEGNNEIVDHQDDYLLGEINEKLQTHKQELNKKVPEDRVPPVSSQSVKNQSLKIQSENNEPANSQPNNNEPGNNQPNNNEPVNNKNESNMPKQNEPNKFNDNEAPECNQSNNQPIDKCEDKRKNTEKKHKPQ